MNTYKMETGSVSVVLLCPPLYVYTVEPCLADTPEITDTL